ITPKIIRKPVFWLILCLSGTVVIVLDWQAADNHKYLLLYWLWVLFLCYIFLMAVAQKLVSSTYRSGEMFEYLLYMDHRFTAFGKLLGIDPSVADTVQKTIAFFRSPFTQVVANDLEIPGTDRARAVALIMTWWDVVIQSLIG